MGQVPRPLQGFSGALACTLRAGDGLRLTSLKGQPGCRVENSLGTRAEADTGEAVCSSIWVWMVRNGETLVLF